MRKIDKIIIHCSATSEGHDYTVNDINAWHKQRGFDCIGYHKVIYRDGSVHDGRAIEKIGAHCVGQNGSSIGICYIGGLDSKGNGKPKDTRTEAQKAALRQLVDELCKTYGLTRKNVYGHCEFAAKACPCFDVKKEFRL